MYARNRWKSIIVQRLARVCAYVQHIWLLCTLHTLHTLYASKACARSPERVVRVCCSGLMRSTNPDIFVFSHIFRCMHLCWHTHTRIANDQTSAKPGTTHTTPSAHRPSLPLCPKPAYTRRVRPLTHHIIIIRPAAAADARSRRRCAPG